MADVPCECGHGPFLRVHNRVLNDVCRAGHVLWKVPLHPARRSARFGQETSRNEAVGWSNLSENDIFSQNMVTVGEKKRLWIKTIQNLCVIPINTAVNITLFIQSHEMGRNSNK